MRLWLRAAPRPGQGYFRTQIIRTTESLASPVCAGAAGAVCTPGDARVGCAPPRHAEEAALRVERGGAGKSAHRHRLAQFDRIAVGEPRLDFDELAAAVLLFRIGN